MMLGLYRHRKDVQKSTLIECHDLNLLNLALRMRIYFNQFSISMSCAISGRAKKMCHLGLELTTASSFEIVPKLPAVKSLETNIYWICPALILSIVGFSILSASSHCLSRCPSITIWSIFPFCLRTAVKSLVSAVVVWKATSLSFGPR